MNDFLHFLKHFIGLCGEYSHPSILISGGVFLTTMGLYWKKAIGYTKKSKTYCLECGEDGVTRDLLYEYNAADVMMVREYMEDHLISYPKHKSIIPEWCEGCNSLKGYRVSLHA